MSSFRAGRPFNAPGHRTAGHAGDEPVEQLVAGGPRASAMVVHHLGPAPAMASAWRRASWCSRSASGVSETRARRSGVVGVVGQMAELLVDDAQLLAQGAQAVADLRQAALDQRPVHDRDHTDGPCRAIGHPRREATNRASSRRVVDHGRLLGHRRHLAPHVRGHPRALLAAMDAGDRDAPLAPAADVVPARRVGRHAGRPRATWCWRTARSLPNLHALPADFPLGYHWLQPAGGPPAPADRLPRPLLAARRPGVGLGGAALRDPQPGQLGHRRPRPTCARSAGWPPTRAPASADQPAARRRARSPGRRRAPTCRPPAASATRSTCGCREVPGADGVDLEDDAGRALSERRR